MQRLLLYVETWSVPRLSFKDSAQVSVAFPVFRAPFRACSKIRVGRYNNTFTEAVYLQEFLVKGLVVA